MPSRTPDFPVLDADNHMDETADALIKYLPLEYDGLIEYVQVDGGTKIAVNILVSDYIPNPTFGKVAAPGAPEKDFTTGNPKGGTRREIPGRGIDAPSDFSEPEPRFRLMDELGLHRAVMWPHEEDPKGLVAIQGADRVLFGSDSPRPEGMSDPITFIDDLAALPDEDIKKVMGGNLDHLMGFDQAA